MNGNNLNYFGHECSFKSYGYLSSNNNKSQQFSVTWVQIKIRDKDLIYIS